jgi:hypothetical protein
MTSGQKAGVVLTIVADALWLVVVMAILATPPDVGANIGAGLLGLLALPLSIVAAAVLITTATRPHLVRRVPPPSPCGRSPWPFPGPTSDWRRSWPSARAPSSSARLTNANSASPGLSSRVQ